MTLPLAAQEKDCSATIFPFPSNPVAAVVVQLIGSEHTVYGNSGTQPYLQLIGVKEESVDSM
jgi:hypothetical protein